MMQEMELLLAGVWLQVCSHHAAVCMHVRGSLCPMGIFACSNRCFVTLLHSRGQVPISLLSSIYLPFFFLSQASVLQWPCWCHLSPSGIAEESGHVVNWFPVQLQLQWDLTVPFLLLTRLKEKNKENAH